MRYLLLTLFLFTGVFPGAAQKSITINDCFSYFRFYQESADNLRFVADSAKYMHADQDVIFLMDFDMSKQAETLVETKIFDETGNWDAIQHTDDLNTFLFRTESTPVYRHSTQAAYWTYKRGDEAPEKLHEKNTIQFAKLAPTGEKVAFVLENNLYFRDLMSGKTTQVTSDGLDGQIINGLPDWLYEEEFSALNGGGMEATVWSDDGRYLAFIRFDESRVPYVATVNYGSASYPVYRAFKFPKVGEPYSVVKVYLYDTETEKLLGHLDGIDPEDYVPRIQFDRKNRLVATRLNRYQDTLELLRVLPGRTLPDGEGGHFLFSRLMHRETDKAYVDLHDNLHFLEHSDHFIWTSDRDGYNHIYQFPLNPNPDTPFVQLTKGEFDVTYFFGINEQSGKFYYQAATPTPLDRQIWEGSLDGSAPRLMTPGTGTHEAEFSPDLSFYMLSWSDANTPVRTALLNLNGDTIRKMVDNRRLVKNRKDYGFVTKEFWSFEIADGTRLNGYMLKPDSLESGKKYPVLFDIYGGPGSQSVVNAYDTYLDNWRQMLVQKGYIVVSLDNRGTGARGRDFKKITQLQLGKLETEDQIAAARHLAKLPYVDPDRIGIWGWSYGGYLSTSCILKGNDVFKMAVAVAPVTNWKWYDSGYTERYMHSTSDNESGYEENAPINFVDQLEGKLLICHGMADDNVHYQHSIELINALIREGKQFDTLYYPNRNHGIYGNNATRHLFTKLTNFILENL